MLRGDSIVLLGHGCDSSIILEQASNNKNGQFSAYIVLNIDTKIDNIQQIQSPLLDIQSSNDAMNNQNESQWSKILDKSGGKQIELPMADDVFSGQEDSLTFLISDWLRKF